MSKIKKKYWKKITIILTGIFATGFPIMLTACTANVYGVSMDVSELYDDVSSGKLVEIHPHWPYKRSELKDNNILADFVEYKLIKQDVKCSPYSTVYCEDSYTYKAISKKSNLIIKKGFDTATYSEKKNFKLPASEVKNYLSDRSSTVFGSSWSHYDYSTVESKLDYSLKTPLNYDYDVEKISVSVPFDDFGAHKIQSLRSILNGQASVVVEDYLGNKYSERQIDLSQDKLVFHDSSVGEWYHTALNILAFNPWGILFDLAWAAGTTSGSALTMPWNDNATEDLNNKLAYIFGYSSYTEMYNDPNVDSLWKDITKYSKGIFKLAVPFSNVMQATSKINLYWNLFRTSAAGKDIGKMIAEDIYRIESKVEKIASNIGSYSFDIYPRTPINIPYGGKLRIQHNINYQVGAAFKTTPFHWWSKSGFSISDQNVMPIFTRKSTSIGFN